MTKKQIIQAVINKARENNILQNYTDSTIAELYENCEKELGTERFNFYEKHHRLTDLLYKLLDNSIALNNLKTLDEFSLENDRQLPRLLQADENELSSSSKEIAKYDLFEYDPRLNLDQKKMDFNANKTVQELLNFIFDDIMSPMAEQRARLYKKLKPLNEELQKHLKRKKELENAPNRASWYLAGWLIWMEEIYIKNRINKLSPRVKLLEKKIDMFSWMIDKFCCQLRSLEKGEKTKAHVQRFTLKKLYSSVFNELFKYSGFHSRAQKAFGSNAYRMEKFPEQFKPLPEDCQTPTGRETKKATHSNYPTECYNDQFCIFNSTSDVFAERRHDILFYDFMRGLAGTVLVPLRGLFHAVASLINCCVPTCKPENAPLQTQAFFSTNSNFFLNKTQEKFFKKYDEINKKYKTGIDRDADMDAFDMDAFDNEAIKPSLKIGM